MNKYGIKFTKKATVHDVIDFNLLASESIHLWRAKK